MLESSNPFPWWLWLLSALWTGSLILRRRVSAGSEWRHVLDVSIGVYALLLFYLAVRGATNTAGLNTVSILARAGFWTAAAFAVGGGLLAYRNSAHSHWSFAVCLAGVAGLSAWWQAYELMVLCLVFMITVVVQRRREALPAEFHSMTVSSGTNLAESNTADSQPRRSTAVPLAPHRDGWAVFAGATLVCVMWLGLVQYAFRVELNRPGPSRWYTAIPRPELVQRWQTNLRKSANDAAATQALSGTALLLMAGVVWMSCRCEWPYWNSSPSDSAEITPNAEMEGP